MSGALVYLLSSFWAGAVHAATPGHGKTIAAAYIVGARGKPIDAVILGVFVTLSHVSGILLVGLLASLGVGWLVPGQIQSWLALAMGLLVIGLGGWMLFSQRRLVAYAFGQPGRAWPQLAAAGADGALADHDHAHPHEHEHDTGLSHFHGYAHDHHHRHGHHHTRDHDHAHHHHHAQDHDHPHVHEAPVVWHQHGFGAAHAHPIERFTQDRPKLAVLLGLSIAGGLLPDPTALAILLAALSSGAVLLGLATVLVFSLGFAAALVLVGVIAAKFGERVLGWLDGLWAARVQVAMTLLILVIGLVLTAQAVRQLMPA